MAKSKKPKQRAFFIWRPTGQIRKPDKRRCRHVVRRTSNNARVQCSHKAEVFFDHEGEKNVGACIEHNPFNVGRVPGKTAQEKTKLGILDRWEKKRLQIHHEVAALAVEWAACDYQDEDLKKLKRATERYLRYERKKPKV